MAEEIHVVADGDQDAISDHQLMAYGRKKKRIEGYASFCGA